MKHDIAKQFKFIPEPAERILRLNARFFQYDVVYDDEDQMNYNMKKAAENDVVVVIDADSGFNSVDLETCEGKLYSCIVYLNEYLKADAGYQGAMALEILDKTFTDDDFTRWCVWMNEWLPDWIDGIKDNDVMKSHFKQSVADEYAKALMASRAAADASKAALAAAHAVAS